VIWDLRSHERVFKESEEGVAVVNLAEGKVFDGYIVKADRRSQHGGEALEQIHVVILSKITHYRRGAGLEVRPKDKRLVAVNSNLFSCTNVNKTIKGMNTLDRFASNGEVISIGAAHDGTFIINDRLVDRLHRERIHKGSIDISLSHAFLGQNRALVGASAWIEIEVRGMRVGPVKEAPDGRTTIVVEENMSNLSTRTSLKGIFKVNRDYNSVRTRELKEGLEAMNGALGSTTMNAILNRFEQRR
jgi:hypothetical protein